MNRVFIFDVDGTLTPSRQPMTKKFQEFFEQWALKNTFYLVTGSDLPKLQEQMNGMEIHSSGIFTCCGNEFWQSDPAVHPRHCDLIYENKFELSDKLMKYLNLELDYSPYKNRYGNHIEDRGSMVNFSIVGRDCNQEQRNDYFEYDNEKGERKRITEAIKRQFPKLDAVIGGQISIDIYPKGMDKSQVFDVIEQERLVKADEYIFIGDRMEEGGNDYPLAQLLNLQDRPYGYTYETEGPEHTKRMLENTHNG
jgi:phosphomannomutase